MSSPRSTLRARLHGALGTALALGCLGLVSVACDDRSEPKDGLATAVEGPEPGDATPDSATLDPATGLLRANGWTEVRAHCLRCHSIRQITNQRGDRRMWRQILTWMQRDHGLYELPDETEELIVNYLAEHYSDDRPATRRAALRPDLLPANPYAK